jgi:peptidoglycan/LPS O-acetylase OafA/YrhL
MPTAIETRPRTVRSSRAAPPSTLARTSMGYQPGLDGLRAISVVAVILYHAGFSWMHGGFFGVEVFFVVSGYLITMLLIEEREKTGGVSLSQFWLRRARRLFPALFLMMFAVAAWTAVLGTAEQASRLKRDLPWSIFYLNNWGQIVGEVPYFQPGDPPLLRHLWSLAVEEQWYLVWPVIFTFVLAGKRPDRVVRWLAIAIVAVMALTWWVQRGAPAPIDGPIGFLDGADRVNFNYLSTFTRSGGLLLGAAAAFLWRPWRSEAAYFAPSRGLDIATGVGLGALICCFIAAELTADYLYPWLLAFVSVVSLILVLVVVHPASAGTRFLLSQPSLVEIGKRSYGWYLWHWPVFVVLGATHGSWPRFLAAIAVSLAIAEVSYRYVEEPVRRGALGRWWQRRASFPVLPVTAACAAVLAIGAYFVQVDEFDVAAGGDDAVFDLGATVDSVPVAPAVSTPAAPVVTAPLAPVDLPRSVSIVGDSQAHSLAVNLPDGIGDTFDISDHSLDGCSIYDNGRVLSSRSSFSNSFGSLCADWTQHWADAAEGADVVLVVLGAWDVFDLELESGTYTFGTPEWNGVFTANLNAGLDAIAPSGARVGLLEAACMRPVEAEGAGVPPLPERGDDVRVAHINELMRSVADARPEVTFVPGPAAWCNDEGIATDLGYRWDGVHVYKPGANLVYETIAPTLLALGR